MTEQVQKSQPYKPSRDAVETPSLGPGALEGSEFVRQHWCAKIAQGVRFEELLRPEFWAHHAYRLSPWDKIEARAEDGTWYAEFIVADCSRNWARVMPILGPVRMTTQDQSMTQASNLEVEEEKKKYRTQHRGAHKWCIVRIADSAVLEQGIQDKVEAEKQLDELARKAVGAPKAMAAPAPAEA